MRSLVASLYLESRAVIGESPVWDAAARVLWWIDWARGRVYRTDSRDKTTSVFAVDTAVSAVALSSPGRVVLALDHGFAELDSASGRIGPTRPVEPDGAPTRICDGKCDARGRFWAGTMALDEQSTIGALFVLERDGRVRRVLGGAICSNGLGWSPDNATFYYVDSVTRRIDCFDFDLERGTVANRRVLVQIDMGDGLPDGLSVDREGYLWVALWDGWQVRRYSPAGDLDTTVSVPVARPTSCAFGGAGMRDLFITTALPDGEDERRAQPLAGSVLRVLTDTPGLPANRCCVDLRSDGQHDLAHMRVE